MSNLYLLVFCEAWWWCDVGWGGSRVLLASSVSVAGVGAWPSSRPGPRPRVGAWRAGVAALLLPRTAVGRAWVAAAATSGSACTAPTSLSAGVSKWGKEGGLPLERINSHGVITTG